MKYPPGIVIQLVHIHGPMKGEIQEFSEGFVSIGRHPSCSLRFPADLPGISRNHAEIKREGNQFKLTDLSINGTFLNGKRVQETYLKDGDVLEITQGGPKFSFLTKMSEVATELNRNSSYLDAPRQLPIEEASMEIFSEKEVLSEKPELARSMLNNSAQQSIGVHFDIPSQKVSAPLIIQFGPSIRSYRELPITIGKHAKCDFVLRLPSILDQHALILFFHNQYWIKDLSGQNMIQINCRPIEFLAALNPKDEFSLSPQGPLFCFISEGRIAEVARDILETPSITLEEKDPAEINPGAPKGKTSKGFWSKIKETLTPTA